MPSGDAQRTWFPEMVAWLRSRWHEGVSMPTLNPLALSSNRYFSLSLEPLPQSLLRY